MEERIVELETLFERIDVLEEQMQRTEPMCAYTCIHHINVRSRSNIVLKIERNEAKSSEEQHC